MRQGNGSEILGPNDPRSQTIGVIHVAPNDERRSILMAILTQEKLQRKQIVLILPHQNRGFQRPVDYDELKAMRKKIKANMVFVAPSGSPAANFLRHRNFPVYSSLEGYVQSLDDELAESEQRKGWFPLFNKGNGGAKEKQAKPQDQDPSASPQQSARPHVVGGTAAVGGALLGAGAANAMQKRGPGDDADDVDFFNEDSPLEPPSPEQVDAQQGYLPKTPHGIDDDEGGETAPLNEENEIVRASGVASTRSEPDVAPDDELSIIDLQPKRKAKETIKLNQPDEVELHPLPPRRASGKIGADANRNGRSGKLPTGALIGAGAGVAAAEGLARKSASQSKPLPRTSGKMPAINAASTGFPGSTRRTTTTKRSGWPWLILIAVLLLALIGGCVGVSYANPSLFSSVQQAFTGAQPGATISITPDSRIVENKYIVVGVEKNPPPDTLQIPVRRLNTSAESRKINVTASGHTKTPGRTATGTLVFTNGMSTAYTVGAGTEITINGGGASVVTDEPAVIPPSDGTSLGQVSVSAHASVVGRAGNIGAMAIDKNCCSNSNSVFVKNPSGFTGGQDPVDYHFLTQDDVDKAINSVKNETSSKAQSDLKTKLQAGEQIVGNPQCQVQPNVDQPVGDEGRDIREATVSVKASCSAWVMKPQDLKQLVSKRLQEQAGSASDLGPGYKLIGDITTKTQIKAIQPLRMEVTAQGLWAFEITEQMKDAWAKAIAGKPVNEAKAYLEKQKGIAKGKVSIEMNGDKLPTELGLIGFSIQSVPGLKGNDGVPSGQPTVTDGDGEGQPGNG
ncbi:hypothetical protein EI42_04513 [Thermosporothrix hazakensis]|jgi:hypothetical protein|uniref:Baseplate J-like protein n=1 Tax=Thermosporothrix hazakensis TaxID=644383 RepID=A0A326U1R5_THEHA|nr:hypothetical protein [Thermosporothrix hazakensis]PZW24905.1 hypothetical protein EI42_04513 [Thermosporothrix hazakensis]GCE46409.1 hypothetical protein KTH_12780 [Thermosporothrix hazakensis]